ncbi:MAG: hypothetical protein N5P05_001039 [Chroococcopsis gigantea SAG 12.99]|jgi:hypothetical protein|nr:hypothetical protein [Chlorogloea purpurea SAG 13.99]MDV2999433.1 hypothetical protein [Chroococcopsis gigantea SAG 12.99]
MRDLEKSLEIGLQEKLGSSLPLRVTCSVAGDTLAVVVHADASLGLSSTDVLLWTKDILARDPSLSGYRLKTYLMFHDDDSLILSPLTTSTSPLLALNHWWEKIILPRLSPGLLSAGLALSLLVAAIYALSRPCVLGSCPHIDRARQLAKEAVTSIDLSASDEEVKIAGETIARSMNILRSIPPWSPYHDRAQTLLFDYASSSDQLSLLEQSLSHATQALSLTRKSGKSVEQWHKVQSLWRQAVSPLAKFSIDSSFYGFSQVKLYQYRSFLSAASQSLQVEQESLSSLTKAERGAQINHIKHRAAQSPQEWESVLEQWQDITGILQRIRPETTSYPKARQLLNLYLPLQVSAQKNFEREKQALSFYKDAINLARQAEIATDKSQWTQGAQLWQKALNVLQQVQVNTFQYRQLPALIQGYNSALKQAQKNIGLVTQQEGIERDVKTICANVCIFTVGDNVIKLTLKQDYTNQIQRTAIEARKQTNVETEIDLLNHLSRLESSLQTISNNSYKVVQVYNSHGSLISVYEPEK